VESEKKATSLPERMKESRKSTTTVMISMVVAATVTSRKTESGEINTE
jgi:hypothetical protein